MTMRAEACWQRCREVLAVSRVWDDLRPSPLCISARSSLSACRATRLAPARVLHVALPPLTTHRPHLMLLR